jgi:uncharacterized membrane protein
MSKNGENWLAVALATIGIAGAGFAAGLHRLVWTLFWVVAAVWMLLCWWAGSKSPREELLWWLLAIGPTLIVGIVLRVVEGIARSVFGGLTSTAGATVLASRQNEPGPK